METDPRHPAAVPKFEEVYPRHDFAPLVRLALTAGTWMKGVSGKKPQALHSTARPRHLSP